MRSFRIVERNVIMHAVEELGCGFIFHIHHKVNVSLNLQVAILSHEPKTEKVAQRVAFFVLFSLSKSNSGILYLTVRSPRGG